MFPWKPLSCHLITLWFSSYTKFQLIFFTICEVLFVKGCIDVLWTLLLHHTLLQFTLFKYLNWFIVHNHCNNLWLQLECMQNWYVTVCEYLCWIAVLLLYLRLIVLQPYMEYPPLRALFLIATNGSPGLREPAKWSDTFKDFLSKCTATDPDERATTTALLKVNDKITNQHLHKFLWHCIEFMLQHPFLKMACPLKNLVPLIKKTKEIIKESGSPLDAWEVGWLLKSEEVQRWEWFTAINQFRKEQNKLFRRSKVVL